MDGRNTETRQEILGFGSKRSRTRLIASWRLLWSDQGYQ